MDVYSEPHKASPDQYIVFQIDFIIILPFARRSPQVVSILRVSPKFGIYFAYRRPWMHIYVHVCVCVCVCVCVGARNYACVLVTRRIWLRHKQGAYHTDCF